MYSLVVRECLDRPWSDRETNTTESPTERWAMVSRALCVVEVSATRVVAGDRAAMLYARLNATLCAATLEALRRHR